MLQRCIFLGSLPAVHAFKAKKKRIDALQVSLVAFLGRCQSFDQPLMKLAGRLFGIHLVALHVRIRFLEFNFVRIGRNLYLRRLRHGQPQKPRRI